MRGTAVGVALLVAFATCSASMNDTKPDNTKPENVLSMLRMSGRLEQILSGVDTDNNQRFTVTELTNALFRNADTGSPPDGRVSWSEFFDFWRSRAPVIPPTVLVKMFYLLDALNADGGRTAPGMCQELRNVFSNVADVGDGELQPSDITSLASFGAANDTTAAVRQAFEMWIGEAARLVHVASTSPFQIGEEYSVEFDYDKFSTDIDVNNDCVISQGELEGLLTTLGASPTTSATRQQWLTGTTQRYKQSPYSSLVFFDAIDSDMNNKLEAKDLLQLYKMADSNMDERVTKQELYRFMQRTDKLIRRMLGLPIKPFMYDCPQVYWDDECGDPDILATIATMDADYDFDGKITKEETRLMINFYPNTGGNVSRADYLQFSEERYDQDMAEADIEFDAIDENGDGYFSLEDTDEEDGMCACEYRMNVLSSARAAVQLAENRKKEAKWLRLKYSMLITEASQKAKKREPMAMDPWYWMTMNGGPAKEGCKACTAKQNWGKAEGMTDKDYTEDDWGSVQKLMEAVHGLVMEQVMGGENRTKLAKWLSWKMNMLKQEVENKMEAMDDTDGGDDMKWKPEDKDWKPWGDKPSGNKPWGDKPSGQDGKPWGDKPSVQDWKPWGDEPSGQDGKPWGDKPSGQDWKPWGDKPSGQDKKDNDKKWGQDWKAWNDKPWGQDLKDDKMWGQGWKVWMQMKSDDKKWDQDWKPWKMDWKQWKPMEEEQEDAKETEPSFGDFLEWMKQKHNM